jgi:hypothetical protein
VKTDDRDDQDISLVKISLANFILGLVLVLLISKCLDPSFGEKLLNRTEQLIEGNSAPKLLPSGNATNSTNLILKLK